MKGKPVRYSYQTNLQWIGEKKGILQSKGKPDINVACPPEFGGHCDIWSPEDFFLASIEVCTMTTFLWLVNKEKIQLKSYKSEAKGIAELIDNVFRFQTITIHLKIVISSEKDRLLILKILDKIPNVCMVSKSILPNVDITAEVIVE